MSYLSRILKKQYRILSALETTPLIMLNGLNLKKIIVFPERKDTSEQSLYYSKILQDEIISGKYTNIKRFDATHTADIEFSCLYRGKYTKKYNNRTKQQLVILGNKWRKRLKTEHPDAQVWIVVHYDNEDGWFLDTFNWNVSEDWATKPDHTIWL